MTWAYTIVPSQGGQVQTPNGVLTVQQMLNIVGGKGGDLIAVVPVGNGTFEWIFKFAAQVPQQLF